MLEDANAMRGLMLSDVTGEPVASSSGYLFQCAKLH